MNIVTRTLVVVAAVAAVNLGAARADQPHMQRALDHLRAAKAELEQASHDKGGWRSRAIKNVEQAIADTEKGVSFDRGHGPDR